MSILDRITKKSELIKNDSLSVVDGLAAQQNHNAYKVFYRLLGEEIPKRVLEIGTGQGGFINFLSKSAIELSLDTKFVSYDVHEHSWFSDLNSDNLKINVKNIFSETYDSVEQTVIDYIREDGLTIVLCDGGNKVNEFKLLSDYIKVGDIIMCHDYSPDSKYFKDYMINKIWNWMEICDEDIQEYCSKNNLEKYQEAKLLSVAWGCWRKIS